MEVFRAEASAALPVSRQYSLVIFIDLPLPPGAVSRSSEILTIAPVRSGFSGVPRCVLELFGCLSRLRAFLWLAGCETTSTGPETPCKSLASADTSAADPEATGSIKPPPGFLPRLAATSADLAGEDPNDDLNLGKKYFRQGSYGIAERHFRKAVERSPEDAESWMGLAASYDRLKRFDLADRAYGQAIRLVGPTPEIMNNQGFSYMLRGDLCPRAHDACGGTGERPGEPLHQEQHGHARPDAAQGEGHQSALKGLARSATTVPKGRVTFGV